MARVSVRGSSRVRQLTSDTAPLFSARCLKKKVEHTTSTTTMHATMRCTQHLSLHGVAQVFLELFAENCYSEAYFYGRGWWITHRCVCSRAFSCV
jgi:hypothetical protein